MDMREAFEKLYPREELTGKTTSVYASPEEHEYAWGAWKAACEWQKQKDAEICEREGARVSNEGEFDYAIGTDICAEEIREQYK